MNNVLQRLLVPVDGSKAADVAITLAARLGRQYNAEIILCNTVDYVAIAAETSTAFGGDLRGTFETLELAAKEVLSAASKRLKDEGFDARGYKLGGRAARAIISFAIEQNVDGIVMGTRGLGGLPHLVLGSTAEGVLRMATVPVFVVRSESEVMSTTTAPTILAAVDDSEPGDAAVAFATELAASASGRLILDNVVDVESLYEYAARYGTYISDLNKEWEAEGNRIVHDAAERALAGGVKNVEQHVGFGDPVQKIIDDSRAEHADFIAIGTHGRRGLRRFTMGSVAESVVRKSTIPVVVVRSYADLVSGKSADEVDTRAQLVTA